MPMQPEMSVKEEVRVTNGKFRLLSLYGDVAASGRARWAVSAIARVAGPDWQTTSETWKIDSLNVSQPIRQMITNDAANADAILIAAGSLEPALLQWLDSLETRNRPVPGLLIGLIGDDETTTVDLSLVVKPLIHGAQKMGWNFIWHWMGEDAMSDADWLTAHVQDLLAGKSAANDGMIFC